MQPPEEKANQLVQFVEDGALCLRFLELWR
jgi:hypothetical protein